MLNKLKTLPSSPGVYLMKDSQGSIIYVGKSKNLKSRVHSYFQNSKNQRKVEKLVKHLKDLDYIETDTEFEALLLECKLIKEIQPLYNRLMKNPTSYTYVRFNLQDGTDRIKITNTLDENDGNLYFGPYSSKNTVEKAIQGILDVFKMNCNSPNMNSPCLNYSIEKCLGMCHKDTAIFQYNRVIDRVIALFEGTSDSILDEMKEKMRQASEDFEFESAATIRNHIQALHSLLKKEKVIAFIEENKYYLVLEVISDGIMKVFLIQGNDILFGRKFTMKEILTVQEQLIELVLGFAKQNHSTQKPRIRKDEIDESIIIFNYLTSHKCEHVLVRKEWSQDEIREAIKTLFSSIPLKVK